MKKNLLVGLLLLTSACQSMTPPPPLTPSALHTRRAPTLAPASPARTMTATSTPIPPPTLTFLPPARYFTEEFEAAPVYWSTLYASGAPGRIEMLNRDGKLIFELYGPNAWLYAVYGAQEYDSVHLETRIESRGSDKNYMGLVCHYAEQAGWYEFNLSSDGSYNVLFGQWLAEGIARYTPILNDTSERIEKGNAINEMGLDCMEDVVQLYVNGKLIRKIDTARFGLGGGKAGISAASFDELPVILAFDWVKVSEP